MITAEQVQSILRALNPQEVDVADQATIKLKVGGIDISANAGDFEGYLQFKQALNQSTPTSICGAGYFEQAIEMQGRGPNAFRLFREAEAISLRHEQTGFTAEISPLSSKFVMYLTDTDTMDREFRRLALVRRSFHRSREEATLTDLFSRFLSVKIAAPVSHPYHNNAKQLKSIADASLYHVAYGYGVGLVPITSWERSLRFFNDRKKESVQFPLRTYNHELVAYYQMALGGESLILTYLALYKIVEYFFTAASEHLLHEKMKEQLVAPDFGHTKVGKLRELAKVVRKFDQKMDERRMMQTVFEQHIDGPSLRSWIEEFDDHNASYFTIERELFGDGSRIDTSDNQIFPTVGARIYHIRNALVHNKEGEISRFVPFSGQEKILMNEVPLLRRIAEELIIKTGKDLQL